MTVLEDFRKRNVHFGIVLKWIEFNLLIKGFYS